MDETDLYGTGAKSGAAFSPEAIFDCDLLGVAVLVGVETDLASIYRGFVTLGRLRAGARGWRTD